MKRLHAMFVRVMFCHANACTECRTRTVATNFMTPECITLFATVSWIPLARLCPSNPKRAQKDLCCDCRTMCSLTKEVLTEQREAAFRSSSFLYSPFFLQLRYIVLFGPPANQPASQQTSQPASQPASQARDRLVLFTLALSDSLQASPSLSGPD